MTADTLDWVGQTLAGGRYRVAALLGEGGMGAVYQACDAHLDTDVVVKVPKTGLVSDREFAGRFAREVRSLVRLAHAHIVRVLDVGEHQGLPFAVMQYLDGGSLRDHLERSSGAGTAAALADLASWLPGVADALDYIHRQGYVHRDVKPENILFDATGHVYLGDFGIAKALAAEEASAEKNATFKTAAGLVVGTPQYMAPELITGQGCDGRVDQYALAVTVYEAVCGRLPFDGPTPAALVVQHATKPPAPLHEAAPGVPLAFSTALLRSLAKDPRQRFDDCRSLAQALAAAVPGGAPPPLPSSGWGTQAGRATDGTQAHSTRAEEVRARTPAGQAAVPLNGGVKECFSCPHCSAAFRLPAEKRGRSARCPRCHQKFIVGDRAAETPAAGMMPTPHGTPALEVPSGAPTGGSLPSGGSGTVPVAGSVSSASYPAPRQATPPPLPAGPPNAGERYSPTLPGMPMAPALPLRPATPRGSKARWLIAGGALALALMLAVVLVVVLRSDRTTAQRDDTRREEQQEQPRRDTKKAVEACVQRAKDHHKQGKYPEALDEWTEAKRLAQDNDALLADVLAGRAETHLARSDYESALADCTEAQKRNSNLPGVALLRARANLGLKRPEKAVADLETANDAPALVVRGRAHLDRSEYTAACDDFRRACALEPANDEACYWLGETLRFQGNYAEAIDNYSKALSRKRTGSALAGRGSAYRSQGSLDAALADLNAALGRKADHTFALAERGEVNVLRGQYRDAVVDCTRAIQLGSRYYLAYRARGIASRELNQHDDAIRDLNMAIELNGGDPAPWIAWGALGETYRRKGDTTEALKKFAKAVDLNGKYAYAHARSGFLYRLGGQYEPALKSLNKALELVPNDAFSLAERGEVQRRLGNWGEAITDCTRALQLNPKDSLAYRARGLAYIHRQKEVQRKDMQQAVADLTQALNLNFTESVWETYLWRGEAHRLLGEYDEAIKDCDKALAHNDKYVLAYGTRGAAYRARGSAAVAGGDGLRARQDFELAAKDLEKALELDDKYVFACREHGRLCEEVSKALRLTGNPAGAQQAALLAQKYYDKAKQLEGK
jgi:tetratricopeptide (TPR) repeat protein/tRNA A-37 threonylcarbamoyl transferase component Bud32